MKRLILAGGGHAHLVVLEHLAREPLPDTEVVLVTPTHWQYYSGMLPGWIAGLYREEDCRIYIRPLARRANVALIIQSIAGIDAGASRVTLADGSIMDYDYLSLDIGAEARNPWAVGLEETLISAKPLDRFQKGWVDILNEARQRKTFSFAVVGGGAAGVELSLVCKTALDAVGVNTDMSLVMGRSGLLHEHAPVVRARAKAALERKGIRLIDGRARGESGALQLDSGERLTPDRIIAATGANAPGFLKQTGLALDENGFVATNAFLQSVSHPNVFATGDISSRTDIILPRSGVHAVRGGPVLARNVSALVDRGELVPYAARKHSLYIMASGKGTAIASWGNWSAEGYWIWRWKDLIDRRFMRRFQNVSV